jgi:hypothetical protein
MLHHSNTLCNILYMIFWKWSGNTQKNNYEKSFVKPSSQFINHTPQHETNNRNKREIIDGKLSSRSMMPQIGLNPFLQNSFETDLTNYDNHMKKLQ